MTLYFTNGVFSIGYLEQLLIGDKIYKINEISLNFNYKKNSNIQNIKLEEERNKGNVYTKNRKLQ